MSSGKRLSDPLDTHAAVWLASDDPALGQKSRSMALAERAKNQLAISRISFWEMALLAVRGRLEMRYRPAEGGSLISARRNGIRSVCYPVRRLQKHLCRGVLIARLALGALDIHQRRGHEHFSSIPWTVISHPAFLAYSRVRHKVSKLVPFARLNCLFRGAHRAHT